MPKVRRKPPFWRRGKPHPKHDIARLRPENRPRGQRFETIQDARAESERSEKLLRSFSGGNTELAEFLQECRAGDYDCNKPFCPICARVFRRWFIGELLRVTKGKEAVRIYTVLLKEAAPQDEITNLDLTSYGHLLRKRLKRAGLVLVDALSEGLKDAETPEQWAIQRKLIEGDVREGVGQYPALETIDVDRSFDQMRAVPPLRQFPLIVLSADRAWGPQIPSMIAAGTLPADVPQNFGYVTDAAQREAQEKLAHLVPNAKHIINTNSGHEIHKEQPQLVIDAIRQVIDAVRGGSRQLAR
jgi:hypothetical protein